ncbi:hypothetical protein ARMGADRAFT_1047402 [Armillaria gallica]|uniref:DNA helicase n=1 Tax=Armillaria gallica TaxID=47427 RepID=A0A2H3DHR4_ARMGA|nr:hypothetical protein ARMGADRAFT_1047402 [Armillaria gallica]
MNMIFAGDFAQLSSVFGGENSALYSPAHDMYASNKKTQNAALGKAIWHQVTTVVILQQNMCQNIQSEEDTCTKDVCRSSDSAPEITSEKYRNVSIITGLNIHKDAYNQIDTAQLTHFFSDDSIFESVDIAHAKYAKQKKTTILSPQIQIELWNAYPSMNNKHISEKLSLCKGLPVMIMRLNSATELGITKGQEATVYEWEESIGSCGQKILETLFVKLSLPPDSIYISGLPKNVIPLLYISTFITCMLQDDSRININHSQVEIIANFAMTDYCSQGKTRPINSVGLNNLHYVMVF